MMNDLVTLKESSRFPGLFVCKYKKKVFYSNLWESDPSLKESRGHVYDVDGNIVIRPFTKIFNRFENNTNISDDEICLKVEKKNGFMAAATFVESVNKVVVSTTGSLDSDFVNYAEDFINDKVKKVIENHYVETKTPYTWLFEICHKKDPHIIEEQEGAYLIGQREVSDESPYFSSPHKETLLDNFAEKMGVFRPKWEVVTFDSIVKEAKECKHEGFLVYGQNSNTALKIKSPFYLSLKLLARKKDILSLSKSKVDEEFYNLIDYIVSIKEEFSIMEEQEKLITMKNFLDTQ